MLEVRVLGAVGASDQRGDLGLGGPTARTVLALLVTNAPAAVPSSRLIEAIWEEDPPRSALKTLQAHVSKLRRALAGDGSTKQAGPVISAGDGYRLDVENVATDLGRFRSLVRGAQHAATWRAALDVWSGEPLAGCLHTELVEAERTRLRAEYLSAVEAWASTSVAEGSPDPVAVELEQLVVTHPLHEHLWALLIEAQAASGRRRDALATYQRARGILAERAGLEPGARLRDAEQAALTGEGATSVPDTRSPAAGTRVPARRSSILGRSGEVAALGELLTEARLVTVTGPGGCGKTTVAAEVARQNDEELEGGAVFVNLVPAIDADGVARALAAAWGIRQLGDDQDVASVVTARLAGRPTLLVLDNCEHVVEAAADAVDRLLDVAEPLRVLATSRQPLEVGGERVWPLAPLPAEDAVDLFVDRLPSVPGGGVATVDREAVAELCRMLDRLPLAIELAAARAGQLAIAEMVSGLANRSDLLRRHRRTQGRHDSLTDTIRWSYDLLDPEEQACLRRLAVFRGSFDTGRAVAVVDGVDDAGIVGVLGGLAAKSLLVVDPSGPASSFRLLDTIRAFAWDQAVAAGDAEDAAVRHRDWYLAWADRVPPGSTCLRLSRAYELEPHHGDLLAALATSHRRGEHEAIGRLAVLASGLLFCPGGQGDAELWIGRALEHADGLPEALVADLLGIGAMTSMIATHRDLARERVLAGADLAMRHRSGAGPLALVLALADFGVTRRLLGHVDTVLAESAELQDDIRTAMVGMRPFWTFVTGGPDEALTQAGEVWSDQRWSDDRTLATWSIHAALLHMAGHHHQLARRLADAERCPADVAPSPFLSVFEALALAGTGAPQAGLDQLRQMRRHHWVRMPGIENDFLAAVAAIADITGDQERARRLLDRPDLWPRHPSTALVQIHHRQRLGLPPPSYLGSTDHTAVSALLDEELA